jgi:PAS domain S-box-containing protein
MPARRATWFFIHGLPLGCALTCQSIGALAVVGWLFDLPLLTRLWPEQAVLPLSVALASFALGTCMYVGSRGAPHRGVRLATRVVAWAVLALAGVSLLHLATGWPIGIDALLAKLPISTRVTLSGTRMQTASALALFAAAAAQLLRSAHSQRRRRLSRAFAACVLLLGLATLGHVAAGAPVTFASWLDGSALTAVELIALGIGQLALAADRDATRQLWRPAAPALPVQWVMALIIAVPLFAGGAVIADGVFKNLDHAIGSVLLFSVITASVLATIVWSVLQPLQSRLDLKQRALAAAHDGVVITRHTKNDDPILYANDAFLRITGYTFDECWGKDCRFLNATLDTLDDERAAIKRALRDGESATRVLRNVRKDGTLFWNRLSLSPIRDASGRVTHHIGIVEDISSEQAINDQLRDLNLEISRTGDALQQSYMEKDALIEIVSHELRSPLNSALTWLSLARDEPTDVNVERALEVIEQSISTQTRLIDDLVDVARNSTQQMALHFEPLDLAALVESSVEELQPSLPEDIRIEFSNDSAEPLLVNADRERLWQVLRNLIGNAAKYNADGGRIRISVRAGKRDALIVVEDDGIGIAADDLGRVFKPFWRANTGVAGAGLGLSIVQSLVRRHGGRVSVESDGIRRGARFTVALPRLSAAQLADVAAS